MKNPYRMHSAWSEDRIRNTASSDWEFGKYTRKGLGGITEGVGHGLAFGLGINKHVAGHWEVFGIGYGSKGKAHNYWSRTGVHSGRLGVFESYSAAASAKSWGRTKGVGAFAGASLRSATPFIGAGLSLGVAAHSATKGYEEGGVLGGLWAGGSQFATDAVAGTVIQRGLKGALTGGQALYGELGSVGRAAWAGKAGVAGVRGYATLAGSAGASATAAIAGTAARGAAALLARAAMFNIYAAPIIGSAMYVNHVVSTAQRDIEAGHRSLGINTTSSLAAFNTKGAWTSRQMSVQAIQRSHLNSRSALGNEAAYMHRR